MLKRDLWSTHGKSAGPAAMIAGPAAMIADKYQQGLMIQFCHKHKLHELIINLPKFCLNPLIVMWLYCLIEFHSLTRALWH